MKRNTKSALTNKKGGLLVSSVFYRLKTLVYLVSLLCLFFSFAPGVFAAYPQRNINWILTSAPGGGTDAWGRKLASVMERTLGRRIILNNMVGAGGATGTVHVWQARHDGYTLSTANDSTPSFAVMTGMQQTMSSNWEFFIAGGSPGVLSVNTESGFKDFSTLLEEARRQPGRIKVASAAGSVWFVQAAVLDRYCGLPLGSVPIAGTQPAILSCVAGETTAVIASIGEVADFVRAGRLIPLVTMKDKDYELEGFGTIPSILTYLPAYEPFLPLKQWQGFMVPVNTPDNVKAVLHDAFVAAMESQEMEDFRMSNHAVFYNLTGKEALDFAARSESVTSWLLYEMNLAQHSPEKFGIPRP